ncbi:hypothetical protein EC912_102692 [Luteibacter rhizovicinus]|uniref:HipA-like C-terminal domain-containing protein n=1 Tax=Luteibacter rhizovicinus TaxID=242606 RepID=A0A4R3YUQ6_9GAMM|nr:hypothetical protein [Luteibacter rhizovicinus]TCV96341.1 hypothetical protein EC912_102692 [Luteibacter rhizovicinus]
MPPIDMFPVRALPEDIERTNLEQLGSKSKFWFEEQGQRVMFKEARPATGEDWAEVVCAELARLLMLPHAKYQLATCGEARGVITPSFIPPGGRLIPGNELIGRVVSDLETARRETIHVHRVSRVMALLAHPVIQLPNGFEAPFDLPRAADVFVGYLLLDALTGNQDRHDENWGVARIERGVHLLPTFDHASSLGRNERDEVRVRRLASKEANAGMEAYVSKARSRFYEGSIDGRRMTTLEAFEAAARLSPKAAAGWIDMVRKIDNDTFRSVLDRVDGGLISEPGREFAGKMLEINRLRLLECEA